MLQLTIPAREYWDERTQEFVNTREYSLELEHSLDSLSKWESKWHKAFLTKQPKTYEETIDYIRCMTLTPGIPPDAYNHLSRENIKTINEYIDNPMTATYISEQKNSKGRSETVTSELIYYWMVALNIPFECQYWHLNRLITLVRVCNIKQSPPKKMSKRDIASRNAALNASRKQQLNTRG